MNILFPFQTHRSTGLKVTKVYKCGFKIIQNGWFQLWFCYPLLPLFFRFRVFSRGPSPISVRRFSMPSRTALPFSTAAWPLWILKINLRNMIPRQHNQQVTISCHPFVTTVFFNPNHIIPSPLANRWSLLFIPFPTMSMQPSRVLETLEARKAVGWQPTGV